MKHFIQFLAATTCCLAAAVVTTSTRAMPPGDGGIEFWVDGPAALIDGGDRDFPDVAVDLQGRSIYVWQDSGLFGASTPRTEIFLRRFDQAGTPLADPIIVNTLQEDDQTNPRIAVSGDGSFLVIWQSSEPDNNNGGSIVKWIRGQAFDANAQPIGGERLYNDVSTGTNFDRRADVAALSGGGYVIVWAQDTPIPPDTGRSIRGRLATANGTPSGDAFIVNSATSLNETVPAVTELDDGGFFAAWRSVTDLVGRRFDSTGAGLGNEFQINTQDLGPVSDPDLARGPEGRILVVWEDAELPGDGAEIRGRLFDSSLVSLGNDFRINTVTTEGQSDPRVAAYADFGFLVVWGSASSAGGDPDASIEGRMVTGVNQFGTPQFLVNDYTASGQYYPAVGSRSDAVAIAYAGPAAAFEPTTEDAIIGQSWSACGIFCDRFEGTPLPSQF